MGLLDILTGKKPLLKPRPQSAGFSTFEASLERALVAPFRSAPFVQKEPVTGTYDTLASARDLELARRGSGDLQSIRQLIIPVTVAGEVVGSPFVLGECTGILLAPRTTGEKGQEFESSETARIYVQVNNSGIWLPMSFNIAPQGSQKGDVQYIAGPIASLRIRVVNVTQDPVYQPNIFMWLVRGITITGQFGGAIGYGAPISSGSGGATAPGTTTGQGSSAPAPAPAPAPTPSPTPAPTPSGGGSGGGGGGGGGGVPK